MGIRDNRPDLTIHDEIDASPEAKARRIEFLKKDFNAFARYYFPKFKQPIEHPFWPRNPESLNPKKKPGK